MENRNLETLILDLKDSLEREMNNLRSEMRRGFDMVNTRFDNQDARLERHAALLQTGSRWSTRMNDWAETIDSALAVKDKQIIELSERLSKLEQKADQPPTG